MRAANLPASSEGSSEQRPYEPSMEEILASIRRIIADDQGLPVRQPPASAESPASVADFPASKPRPAFVPPPAAEPVIADIQGRVEAVAPAAAFDAAPAPVRVAAPPMSAPDDADADIYAEPVRGSARALPVEEAAPEPASAPVAEAPAAPPATPAERLLSPSTDTAVAAAFNMLAASRLANNTDEIMTLAREMIRPLLRNWIDEHLPNMVERMVRAEIERVARGGR